EPTTTAGLDAPAALVVAEGEFAPIFALFADQSSPSVVFITIDLGQGVLDLDQPPLAVVLVADEDLGRLGAVRELDRRDPLPGIVESNRSPFRPLTDLDEGPLPVMHQLERPAIELLHTSKPPAIGRVRGSEAIPGHRAVADIPLGQGQRAVAAGQ